MSQVCTYVPPASDAAAPPPDASASGPRDYRTFDGTSLLASRSVAVPNVDRQRVKPYSALQTEFPRVLATTPASLAAAGTTFGAAPARWFEEPQSSAVSLQTTLNVAFDGCLTYTATDTRFGAAPSAASAATECTAMSRKFWSHTPSPAELQGCVTVATTGSAAEPNARRKWAYACASVLTASGFLTY